MTGAFQSRSVTAGRGDGWVFYRMASVKMLHNYKNCCYKKCDDIFCNKPYETVAQAARKGTNTGDLCDKKSGSKAFIIFHGSRMAPKRAKKRRRRTKNRERQAGKYRKKFCHKDSFSCHKAGKTLIYSEGGRCSFPLLFFYLKDKSKATYRKRQYSERPEAATKPATV